MMLMCPPDVDTDMHHTVGAAAPVDKMTISPGVPATECKKYLSDRFGDTAVIRYAPVRVKVFPSNERFFGVLDGGEFPPIHSPDIN